MIEEAYGHTGFDGGFFGAQNLHTDIDKMIMER